MCTANVDCIYVDTEYSHSSMIIEFFWFLVATLAFGVAVMRLIKIQKVHEIESYEVSEEQKPKLSENDPQRDHMRSPPQATDVNNINIEIDTNNVAGPVDDQTSSATKMKDTAATQPAGFIPAITYAVDLMVNKHLVILIIFVYLVNNFSSYIYSVVCVFLVVIQLFLFNYLRIFERLGNVNMQKYSELSYHFWIVTLFLAYFIHDQSLMNLP